MIEKPMPKNIVPSCYDLDITDMALLLQMAETSLWKALATAFKAGFIQGNHCTINRKMEKIRFERRDRHDN